MIEKIFYQIDEDFWCESKYLNGVYDILKDKLEGDYSVVITPNLRQLPQTKYKKIVLLTGDETFRLGMNPYVNDNVEAVFRIFNRNGTFDNNFIFPIPPGYNWTMHSDKTKKMVRMYPEKVLSDREYDISFIGQELPWRKPIFDKLDILSKKFNIYHGRNKSFRTGLYIDDYYKLLGNTKIVLSPDGTTIDCFRYVEALGSGCIVITTSKDNLWYYKNTPAFFIHSWDQLNEDMISNILSMNIDELYKKNLEYYNNNLSEEAVANYIFDSLTNVSKS
jgi:hypothetical protein